MDGATMTLPKEALIYLLLTACEWARAMEIAAEWETYERGERLQWGLAFTTYDEEERYGVQVAIMDLMRQWATAERAKLGLGPWPDRRLEIEARYPVLRDPDEEPRPKPRLRGLKPHVGWAYGRA